MKKNFETWKIFIGLIVGTLIGLVFNQWSHHPYTSFILKNLVEPVGAVFLQSLFMIIVPLVLSSLAIGVANLSGGQHLKKLSGRLILFYLSTTFVAILIGQTLINTVKPGSSVSKATAQKAIVEMKSQVNNLQQKSSQVSSSLWPGLVYKIIPKNIVSEVADGNMLAIIFIAILLGFGILYLPKGSERQILYDGLSGISNISIKIISVIMKIAPYAVAALMVSSVSRFGLDLIKSVLVYILIVILAYLIQFFVIYGSIIKFILKSSPMSFYKKITPILITAFSTSSSSATMPTTIKTLQENLNIPKDIVNFSIPIGATVNMDGTALFEVVAILFIAQIFGVDLSLTNHITLILLVLLTSIGVAGVPGGSLPILMSALLSLNIPAEGIAVILGVDRLLDMGRTLVNVTGDSVAAAFLHKSLKDS